MTSVLTSALRIIAAVLNIIAEVIDATRLPGIE
jgi:hypothetical protein